MSPDESGQIQGTTDGKSVDMTETHILYNKSAQEINAGPVLHFPYIREDTEESPSNNKPTMEADEVQMEDVSCNNEEHVSSIPGTEDYVESDDN